MEIAAVLRRKFQLISPDLESISVPPGLEEHACEARRMLAHR